MNILLIPPEESEFHDQAILACYLALRSHPEANFTVLTRPSHHFALQDLPPNLKQLSEITDLNFTWDLVINLNFSEKVQVLIEKIKANHFSGAKWFPAPQVIGRWAQTFVAQLNSRNQLPFIAADLFAQIILGKPFFQVSKSEIKKERIYLDDRGFSEGIAKYLQQDLHGQVYSTQITGHKQLKDYSGYIGHDPVLATLIAANGGNVLYFPNKGTNFIHFPAMESAWIVKRASELDKQKTAELAQAFINQQYDKMRPQTLRFTNEYLGGGVCIDWLESPQSLRDLFYAMDYLVFNYINNLIEVDLPLPRVPAEVKLQAKMIMTILEKINHLNLFGIKFIGEFLEDFKKDPITEEKLYELKTKIDEIDQITEKSLSGVPELDLLRTYYNLSKASAEGENLVEVSKSMVLILHEMNQAIAAYLELLKLTTSKES